MFDHLVDAERFRAVLGTDKFALHMGCEILQARPGYAEVKLPLSEKVMNGHGNLHGGVLFALADFAAAIAANLHDAPTMAVNGSISFLSAVREGHVVAQARTVKNGGRMKFQTVEIFDAKGRLVAVFQGGSMHVPPRPSTASGMPGAPA